MWTNGDWSLCKLQWESVGLMIVIVLSIDPTHFRIVSLPLLVPVGHSAPQDAPEYRRNRGKQVEPDTTAGIVGSTAFIAGFPNGCPQQNTSQQYGVHNPDKQSSQVVRGLSTNKLEDMAVRKGRQSWNTGSNNGYCYPFVVNWKWCCVTRGKHARGWGIMEVPDRSHYEQDETCASHQYLSTANSF